MEDRIDIVRSLLEVYSGFDEFDLAYHILFYPYDYWGVTLRAARIGLNKFPFVDCIINAHEGKFNSAVEVAKELIISDIKENKEKI